MLLVVVLVVLVVNHRVGGVGGSCWMVKRQPTTQNVADTVNYNYNDISEARQLCGEFCVKSDVSENLVNLHN